MKCSIFLIHCMNVVHSLRKLANDAFQFVKTMRDKLVWMLNSGTHSQINKWQWFHNNN